MQTELADTKQGLHHSPPRSLHVYLACINSCHNPSGAQCVHSSHLLCYPSFHLLHGSFHTDLSICLYRLSCALCVIHPLFPNLFDLCSLFYLFSSSSNSSSANFFPLPCLQSGITPSHHSIVAHFLRRVLFSAAAQKSRQNSMPNVKSHLKPTLCNSMCNPKRTRVD